MKDEKEDALRKQAKANLSRKGWEALLEGVERVSEAPVNSPSPGTDQQAVDQPERHILRVRDESGRVSEHVTADHAPPRGQGQAAAPNRKTFENKVQTGASETPRERRKDRFATLAGPSEKPVAPETLNQRLDTKPGGGGAVTDPGEREIVPSRPAEEAAQGIKGKAGLVGKWVQKQPLLQKLTLYYRGLSIRDQRLLFFTFVGLSLLFFYLAILEPMLNNKSLLDRKLALKRADLTEMVRLRSSVAQDRGGMDRIKSIVSQRGKDFSVFAYLEQLASKAEMKNRIVSIKPQRETPVGQFRESLVSVKLDGISMEELTRYLYQIETSEDLLYVKNLQIKKVSAGKGVGMDVTLSVGTLIQG
ncbi:MAG: type II secretion system protein GspM [bacterium]|nr:type II secretion system protein GspM [bacterium]